MLFFDLYNAKWAKVAKTWSKEPKDLLCETEVFLLGAEESFTRADVSFNEGPNCLDKLPESYCKGADWFNRGRSRRGRSRRGRSRRGRSRRDRSRRDRSRRGRSRRGRIVQIFQQSFLVFIYLTRTYIPKSQNLIYFL